MGKVLLIVIYYDWQSIHGPRITLCVTYRSRLSIRHLNNFFCEISRVMSHPVILKQTELNLDHRRLLANFIYDLAIENEDIIQAGICLVVY